MAVVHVRLFHRPAQSGAGALECLLDEHRRALARHQLREFGRAGAADARLIVGVDGGFGGRVREVLDELRSESEPGLGLIMLGSGALPLARPADYVRLVKAAARADGPVLTNNRFSGDVVAIPSAADLPPVPDLPGDNALPRWLAEHARRKVDDLRSVWRLQVDLDGPMDAALAGLARHRREPSLGLPDALFGRVEPRLRDVARAMSDRRAEILIAGRSSSGSLRWLESSTASRTRALIEERGLRASSRLALRDDGPDSAARLRRPPRSILGLLLDRDGPESLGGIVAGLADAAVVDTRVLLAHRLGADESSWPSAEDRFASDLLLPERVADPWLRALTGAALDASVPILLGGHSLVGPGLRLVAAAARPAAPA